MQLSQCSQISFQICECYSFLVLSHDNLGFLAWGAITTSWALQNHLHWERLSSSSMGLQFGSIKWLKLWALTVAIITCQHLGPVVPSPSLRHGPTVSSLLNRGFPDKPNPYDVARRNQTQLTFVAIGLNVPQPYLPRNCFSNKSHPTLYRFPNFIH